MALRDQVLGLSRRVAGRAGARLVALADAPDERAIARQGPPLEPVAEPTLRSGVRPVATAGIARGLTPAKVASILREVDDGDPTRFSELMREVEDRDLHLVGVLGTRKRAVANLPWEIVPGGDRPLDRKVADFVTDAINDIDNFEDGLVDLLDAVCQGVAFVELQWERVGGSFAVSSLEYRPQSWFLPDPERLSEWRVRDEADAGRGIPLPPYRFLMHTSKAKSGFPLQGALGRPLLWWWLFKTYAVKDWVTFSELFGAPLRVGKYPAGSKPADVDAMYEALTRLGVDAVAAIPSDMQIEFVSAKSGGSQAGDVQERLVRFCDRAMSKGVLGQTLTTEEGSNGSQALGRVHNDVRQDILTADAKQLARTLTRGLIRPLVLFEFGPNAPIPALRFETEPEADQKVQAEAQEVRAKVFTAARTLGVPVPMAQVQEELGIRAPDQGEAILPPIDSTQTPPAKATMTATQTPSRLAPRPCPICASRGGGHLAAMADTPLPSILEQVDEAAGRYLAQGGEQAWADLVAAMRRALLDGSPSIDEVPARFKRIVESLGPDHPQLVAAAGNLADATLTADLVGQLQVLQGDRVIDDLPQVPPTAAADWWQTKLLVSADEFTALAAAHRSRAFSIAGFTSLDALSKVHATFGEVIRGGGTLDEFEDAIAADGVFLTPAHLENVYRTNQATAYAVGRDTEQRRPRTLQRRPWWRYNAIDDSATRREHELQNGVILRHDDPFWGVWSPPNGYRCRCWRTAHSNDELATQGWTVSDGAVTDPLTGRAPLPDEGFRTDPAAEPDALEFLDWARLPAEWQPLVRAELRPGGTP